MLIAFDLDNTLIRYSTGKVMPDDAALIDELKLRHSVAIATGRVSFLALPTCRQLGVCYLVAANGAEVLVDGELVACEYLPMSELNPANAYVTDRFIYADNLPDDWRTMFNQQAGYDCVRELAKLDRLGRIVLEYENLRRERRADSVNKFTGLTKLAALTGDDISDLAAFGDSTRDDYEIIANAKLSGAMANADDSLKRVASVVISDGLRLACESLGLI